MKKRALVLILILMILCPIAVSAETASVPPPTSAAPTVSAVSASPSGSVTQSAASATPTGTPWEAYTEPPYTPVQPSAGMIVIYCGIALIIAAGGFVVYLILKKAEGRSN